MLSAQLFRITRKHPTPGRVRSPQPRREHDCNQKTLHGPRWNIEDDAFAVLTKDFLKPLLFYDGQVFADQIQMPVPQ